MLAWLRRLLDRHQDNLWHSEQIEHFLHCASDPDYSFKGFEWADYASNADVEVKVKNESPVAASVGQYLQDYWPAKFEPPYARLRCPDCHDEWDIWINEEGEPEDKRDLKCDDCDEFGELVQGD